ncbi:MAG: hypothetical protein J6W60_01850, partial [Treponema sp.]|nr:hypothetical protein [Treponema sp.]
RCAVSHAEPMRAFSRQELIDARMYPGVVKGLIWTNNGEAEADSAAATVNNLFEGIGPVPDGYVSLGGHRPVTGNYKILQNGNFIQIHNPGKQNIVFVHPERKLNIDNDIIEVKK